MKVPKRTFNTTKRDIERCVFTTTIGILGSAQTTNAQERLCNTIRYFCDCGDDRAREILDDLLAQTTKVAQKHLLAQFKQLMECGMLIRGK